MGGRQWLVDLELNLEEISGLDPDVDSYANEVEFKEDLRMMDVRAAGVTKHPKFHFGIGGEREGGDESLLP